MTYRVRYTKGAQDDLHRLYASLLERDLKAARRRCDAIAKGIEILGEFSFACRKALTDNLFLRELVVTFGAAGYVTLFEIEDNETITILAIRHQREEDYH
ncbi:MAG: type II toxin-antitoxin system RelE/ParE family toxin [Glaciimonas sp.]|nr:type II toxin-antitoxin system RelE/ParE family toxin [Glaciimonas sp.]